MALVTPSSDISVDMISAQKAPQIADLVAGEDLLAAAPCYIKTSDGKVYQSNGTAANEAAECVGFTARAAKSGQKVTLLGKGTRFRYADSGLNAGDRLYIGATSGRLDTAPTTGDAVGVAQALTATDIRVINDAKF